jgi:hypothetical protein
MELQHSKIWYIVHTQSGQRLHWYRTLTGARIALRQRHRLMGFETRITRLVVDSEDYQEQELCSTLSGEQLIGPLCIEQGWIEREQL